MELECLTIVDIFEELIDMEHYAHLPVKRCLDTDEAIQVLQSFSQLESISSLQCQITMTHIEKIIKKKSALLLKGNPKRNKPVQLSSIPTEEFKMIHVNVGILWQCSSPHTACCHQCMQLVMTLLPLQPQVQSTKEWMHKTIQTQGAKYLTERFEKGSSAKCGILKYPTLSDRLRSTNFTFQLVISWLENLLGALDLLLGAKMQAGTCQGPLCWERIFCSDGSNYSFS